MPKTIDFENNTFQENYLAIQHEILLLGILQAGFINAGEKLEECFQNPESGVTPDDAAFIGKVGNSCFEELGYKLTYLSAYQEYYVGILEKSIDPTEWNTFISLEHWEELIREMMEYVAFYQGYIEHEKEIDEICAKLDKEIEEDNKLFLKNMDELENNLTQLQLNLENINKHFFKNS